MPEIILEDYDIESESRELAIANIKAAPETEAIYLFPAPDEIRLIEVDATTLPSETITPYYFGADPQSGLHFRSAIAIVRPEEVFSLPPPPGWGSWEHATRLWPEE